MKKDSQHKHKKNIFYLCNMRYINILLLLILPTAEFTQTRSDYEHVMAKFMQFYNNNQPDSLLSLCSPQSLNDTKSIKPNAEWLTTSHTNFGEMTEYKYLHTEPYESDSALVFKVAFTRYFNGMAVKLTKDNRFEYLWLLSSPGMRINTEKRIKPVPSPNDSTHIK